MINEINTRVSGNDVDFYNKNNIYGIVQILPIIFFTAIIITIIGRYKYAFPDTDYYFLNMSSSDGYLYNYYDTFKRIALYICTGFVLIFILYRIINANLFIRKTLYYYPMIIYCLFVVLSYIFSTFEGDEFLYYRGYFQGTLGVICYYIMLFYIVNTVNSKKIILTIVYALTGIIIILCLLGVLQSMGINPLQSTFYQKVITFFSSDRMELWEAIDIAKSNGEVYLPIETNGITQTFGYFTTVSGNMAMILPLYTTLFIGDKVILRKIIWFVTFVLVAYNFFETATTATIISLLIALILALVIVKKKVFKYKISLCVAISVLIALCFLSPGKLMPEIKQLTGINNHSIIEDNVNVVKKENKFDYLITGDTSVEFSINGSDGTLYYNKQNILIRDSNDKELKYTLTANKITINNSKYDMLKIFLSDDVENNYDFCLVLDGDNRKWPFIQTSEGILYINDYGKTVALEEIDRWGFEGREEMFSYRGYIFALAFPMVKDSLIVGQGEGTSFFIFPHNDYVGKHNLDLYIERTWVNSVHNMYLATAIDTGLISLIAMLVFYISYVTQSILIYIRHSLNSITSIIGVGILFSVVSFLVGRMMNVGSLYNMPLFYGLLGLGISINYYLDFKSKRHVDDRLLR